MSRVGKAAEQNITNIEFINAGFLSYHHQDEPADVLFTKAALHHLPDFWKQIALLKMNQMLKVGGLLYLHDVVFNFDPQEYSPRINQFIADFASAAGEQLAVEIETHIRDEYSTFGWIMEGLLGRAGFWIEKSNSLHDGFITEYFCKKVSS